jgi:DMSO reductase iron-sulfur subunit
MADGDAWRHDVFAYYISIACNHCDDPICQQVCPSGAMRKQPDGFVALDSDRCIGCGSCAFACPYKAPSFSHELRAMRKCDGCRTRVAAGLDPICVESCPMRALGFGRIEDLRFEFGLERDVAPLPSSDYTKPNIVITPHRHARPSGSIYDILANEKEI